MKIVVIGGTGFLGKALAREKPPDIDLVLAGSRDANVRDPNSVGEFIQRHRPDWVILAAAVADVDLCEREPALADEVNHLGAINVAEACKMQGARLIFISTDYVFGANESRQTPWEADDPVCPLNAYGRSKVAGEQAVRKIVPAACIARVSWLFGAEGNSFPSKLLDAVESGQKQAVAVCDQRGVPNFAREIARCLMLLVKANGTGIVHVTNPGVTTWYEFSRELLPLAGFDGVELEPVTLAQMNRVAPRPHYSALSDKSLQAYGIVMPHWRESLPRFLADRAALVAQNRR